MANTPHWTPTPAQVERANVTAFRKKLAGKHGVQLPDYAALHDFSVTHREAFWSGVWELMGVLGERGERVLRDGDRMPGARWFPDARLNFAENLLRGADARRDEDALVFWGEDRVRRRLSWGELRGSVARLARALRQGGVGVGDRVAAYLPNLPEAVIGMLAAASIGATWTSTSPDFGVQGVLDRLG